MSKNYILGVFNDEDSLVEAFEKVKAKGILPVEVYTPYPVHEILEGMGKKTRITHAAFFYGLFAAIGILGFLYYAAVISWPLHYGGKPFNSFPSFIVVTIVATILSVTLLTLFTFSVRAKIFPGKKPEIFHDRATDDKFVMVLDKDSLGEMAVEVDSIINEHGKIE
jgi:NADH:ubiquinone oxidoreductase subunit 5 (subunit L)/multisubunit Na+/H+ antiporter MnhA subunit